MGLKKQDVLRSFQSVKVKVFYLVVHNKCAARFFVYYYFLYKNFNTDISYNSSGKVGEL